MTETPSLVKAPRTASFGVDPKRLAGHHSMIANNTALLEHEKAAVDGLLSPGGDTVILSCR
jgi:hypothetical protein